MCAPRPSLEQGMLTHTLEREPERAKRWIGSARLSPADYVLVRPKTGSGVFGFGLVWLDGLVCV